MESLKKRINLFFRAVKTLDNAVAQIKEIGSSHPLYELGKDGCIQRFEYTLELFWKTLKEYLEIYHAILIASPKGIARESENLKIIAAKEYDEVILMIDDRNMTSHAYNDDISAQINKRIPEYSVLMKNIITRVEASRKKIDKN
jgi:nucleotidyltransferase substrate binding protein (TIGR01987 family)